MKTFVAAVALAAVALVPAPATAAYHHRGCASYTSSGYLTNNTGQPVYVSDTDRVLRHVYVATGGSVPFKETLPWSDKKHLDVVTTDSVDYSGGAHPLSGWSFPSNVWIYRPGKCSL